MEYKKIGIILGLEIYYNNVYNYSVWKDGKCLEDGMTFDEAICFCKVQNPLYIIR